MKLSDVAEILQGELIGADAYFYGAATDTRMIEPGQLFFAWKGAHCDAHDFLESIEAKGAIGAVVERYVSSANISQIVVKDSQKALGKLAKAWRKRWIGKCIALTGSNGKTTLKEMIASILNQKAPTLSTVGNYNNHVGCPLTLLKLKTQHQFAVIEMGASGFQEIQYLTKIAKPDIAIITNASACHLEGFKSIAGVAEAKSEIFEGLDKNGVAIINADDPYCGYWKEKALPHKIMTFGIDNKADVYATKIQSNHFTLHIHDLSIDISLKLKGKHNILNACSAAAAAYEVGATLSEIKRGLENVLPVSGRFEYLALNENHQLINDGYKANPASVQAGIDTVLLESESECWLVLGNMRELGETERALHSECGKLAKEKGIKRLFTLGELAKESAQAFGDRAEAYMTHEEIASAVLKQLDNFKSHKVTVLVTGSHSMNMPKIVDIIRNSQISLK